MTAYPKTSTWKSKRYLTFVRSLPCWQCGDPETVAHHLIGLGNSKGVGMKVGDHMAMPLCGRCHAEVHLPGLLSRTQWQMVAETLDKAIEKGVLKYETTHETAL